MTDYENGEPSGALTTQPRRDNQIARQDFQGSSLQTQNGAIEALVAKARADVESACVMAKRWPRNADDVRQDLIAECKRPGFAAVAIYRIPRAGTTIEGLSIRFAEVAMRCMGNMEASSDVIYDDAAVRQIRVQVVDYERNSRWRTDITIPKTVERKQLRKGQRPLGERVNSYGDRVFIVEATDDDVRTKQNAEISKASRTGILRIVPGHLQDEARRICQEVTAAADKAIDPTAARNKMFDAFAAIGVKPSGLEQWLGHSTDTISPAERELLLGLHAAIKEGETSWADALREATAEREADKPAKPQDGEVIGGRKVIGDTPTAAPVAVAPAEPVPTPAVQAGPKPPTQPAELAKVAPRASSGKGTAALKGALTGKPAAAPAPVEPKPEVPPDEPPPKPGFEDRACAGCGAITEVEFAAPAGALCYSCTVAKRESE